MINLSLIAALIASLLVAAKDVVSKSVSAQVNPFVSSLASFVFAIPFYIVILLLLWVAGLESFTWLSGFWMYVFLRALSDTGAESGRMLALQRGELSSVVAIISLHPVITLVFSPLLTGDALSFPVVVGVLLATFGTYFFTKVPKGIDRRTFFLSLVTAVFFSLNNCFDRLSAVSASAAFSGFAMNVFAAILTLPFVLFAVGPRQGGQEMLAARGPFLLRGLFEALFMVVKLYAMSYLQAPVVSALLRLSLVYQVFAGQAFFKEEGFWLRMVGSLLIVSGSVISLL